MNTNIEISHITKKYKNGVTALDDVNFRVSSGVFGLLGHNGAGKTTLMKALVTVLTPSAGTIRICGFDTVKQGNEVRARIGYLPQELAMYPSLSVFDFVNYMAELKGIHNKKAVSSVLEQVEMLEFSKRKIGQLSGGMKRRVGIAQALLNDPEVLILDEPTSGLDPGERVRFRNLLSEFAKDRIVVISTHIVSDVEYIANQNAIMKDGKIIENDTTEQLVRLVDGKIWECKIPSSDLVKWERALKLINLRNEADGTTSIRYLSDQAETPDSVSAVPRLEDLYLWLFPQEGEVRL